MNSKTFGTLYTRDYSKGHSFRYVGDWEVGVHYLNDNYVTDFVTIGPDSNPRRRVLLACSKSHLSTTNTKPVLEFDDDGYVVGETTKYWKFVLGGDQLPEIVQDVLDPNVDKIPSQYAVYNAINDVKSSMPAPDWKQNEPENKNFIKGRTHWFDAEGQIYGEVGDLNLTIPSGEVVALSPLFVDSGNDRFWSLYESVQQMLPSSAGLILQIDSAMDINGNDVKSDLALEYWGDDGNIIFNNSANAIILDYLHISLIEKYVTHEGDGAYIKLPEEYIPNTIARISAMVFGKGRGSNSVQQKNTGATANGNMSVAEGKDTNANGDYSHAEGNHTSAGKCGHSEGISTSASENSHSEGRLTTAAGYTSHAEGYNSKTGGDYSSNTLEKGTETTFGAYAHAEGNANIALTKASHAEGEKTFAKGIASHAEGGETATSKDYCHAEGYKTNASGLISHAEGRETMAMGDYSHAEGYKTVATNNYEHAEGKYNMPNSGTIHSVGIGTSEVARKNAFEIMQNGDCYLYGIGSYDGTNYSSASTIKQVIDNLTNTVSGIETLLAAI